MKTGKKLSWIIVATLVLAACSTPHPPDGTASADPPENASTTDKVLQFLGLKKPASSADDEDHGLTLPGRRIKLRLLASDALNLNASGQPVAVLTRLYQLKSPDAFLKAPFEAFGDPAKEKEALGDDLIETRDVQLIPGQHYKTTDVVNRDIGFIGIVALYRNPDRLHWRYAFKTDRAEFSGVSLALHACAMTVHQGRPVHASIQRDGLASFSCPAEPASTLPPVSENQP